MYIGFQERHADLTHNEVDIILRKLTAPPEFLENIFKPLGQVLKHVFSISPANSNIITTYPTGR
jgi:hypothetical protein